MNTEFEIGPPMESLEGVEKTEHTNDLDIVLWGVLVNEWVIAIVHVEVCGGLGGGDDSWIVVS